MLGNVATILKACFAAGTPLLTLEGSEYIENIREGDYVLTRDENDPDGPVVARQVEEVFTSYAKIWHVHVGGQVIRTTAEHPFWVRGKGWTAGWELRVGDELSSHDGRWTAVEDLLDTGEWETVYNVRVAEHHTYFVGGEIWGFAIWSHNLSCSNHAAILRGTLLRAGKTAQKYAAHLVPTGVWSRRTSVVRKAIADIQKIINNAGIGLDHAANGLFTASSRHLETIRTSSFST